MFLYSLKKNVKEVFMPTHRKKEESDRNADGLTNLSKQMCSSRMTQRTRACVEGREKTHRVDTGPHARTRTHIHTRTRLKQLFASATEGIQHTCS